MLACPHPWIRGSLFDRSDLMLIDAVLLVTKEIDLWVTAIPSAPKVIKGQIRPLDIRPVRGGSAPIPAVRRSWIKLLRFDLEQALWNYRWR